MTKRKYKVRRIYQESSPRENKITGKISVLQYSKIHFNPDKLFGPKVFYHLLHIKLPCVFWILYIPNSEHKIQSLEYIIA